MSCDARVIVMWCHVMPSGRWMELRADRRAALCKKSYTEGGIDFMRKSIELESVLQ